MSNQLYTYVHQTTYATRADVSPIQPMPPMPPVPKTVLPYGYYSAISSTEPYLPDSSNFLDLGRARSDALTDYSSTSSSAMYRHFSNTAAPHSGYSQLLQLQDTWPPAPGVEFLPPGVKRSSEALYDRTLLDAYNTVGQNEASYAMGYLTKRPRLESASHFPIYPQRPGEKDCTHYMQTRHCKFGDTCKFDHPIWVPEGGIPDWKEVLLPATDELYPERPGEPDCPYFMKTQRCKYGSKCKFNHPKERALASGASGHPSTLPERPLEPPCAFYMKTGVCKFGATCKFHHPQDIQTALAWQEKVGNGLSGSAVQSEGTYIDVAVAEGTVRYAQAMDHNSKGLPIRPGEVDCPFYLKTGSCKYGSSCRYNHPEGIATGITHPLVASTAENLNIAAVKPAYPLYQTLDSRYAQPTVGTETLYPQRPGQVECEYYIKTGECKFQERCKYHHPIDRSYLKSKQAAPPGVKLTLAGLPRREGEVHCPYYMKTGTCKFGASCKFDHPTPGEVMLTQVASQAAASQDGGEKEAGAGAGAGAGAVEPQ